MNTGHADPLLVLLCILIIIHIDFQIKHSKVLLYTIMC